MAGALCVGPPSGCGVEERGARRDPAPCGPSRAPGSLSGSEGSGASCMMDGEGGAVNPEREIEVVPGGPSIGACGERSLFGFRVDRDNASCVGWATPGLG